MHRVDHPNNYGNGCKCTMHFVVQRIVTAAVIHIYKGNNNFPKLKRQQGRTFLFCIEFLSYFLY